LGRLARPFAAARRCFEDNEAFVAFAARDFFAGFAVAFFSGEACLGS
jgi:hypothetical protein